MRTREVSQEVNYRYLDRPLWISLLNLSLSSSSIFSGKFGSPSHTVTGQVWRVTEGWYGFHFRFRSLVKHWTWGGVGETSVQEGGDRGSEGRRDRCKERSDKELVWVVGKTEPRKCGRRGKRTLWGRSQQTTKRGSDVSPETSLVYGKVFPEGVTESIFIVEMRCSGTGTTEGAMMIHHNFIRVNT